MNRYEIIPAKRWVHTDGRTASIYGAVPYTSEAEQASWSIQSVGFTIRDNKTNTVGLGRTPFASMADAQVVLTKLGA